MAPPRPPFGTDEPESIYETPNHPQRRIRQPAPVDPNSRTSAYNVYDNYINDASNRQSGVGALGEGFMNGSLDDDDDEPDVKYNPFSSDKEKETFNMPLAATPPPQYVATPMPPPAALSINTVNRNPFASPMDRGFRNGPPQPITVPSTPHPLQPPMTPITPIFARPRQQDIHFDDKPIMRGAGEGTSIPVRGEKGDDFWRRFSMVVKEENAKPTRMKQSSWLKNTQGRTNTMFRWVFFIGMILTICAIGAIVLWWYVDHHSTSNSGPAAIGGSAQESDPVLPQVGATASNAATLGTSLHVSPTNTVARRIIYEPEPTGLVHDRRLPHLYLNRV